MPDATQFALFPESDAVTLPQRPWPISPVPMGDAVDQPPARSAAAYDAPTLFDLDPR